jgi:endoglucanase
MTARSLSTRMLPVAAGLALLLGSGVALAAPPGTLPFGVYDPGGDFIDDPDMTIEHVFLPWEDVSLESLVAADEYAQERNRVLLITVEPWTWTRDERNSPEFLRQGIQTGYCDANMRGICEVIDTLESPVTIRWGHEMEFSDGQFIWSGWNPDDYVAAFRRMIDICRDATPG